MPGKNDSLAGNFESTAQRMLAVLDKATVELSKTVDACVEQLSQYNIRLQKSLSDRLQQIKEQFLAAAEARAGELDTHKEKLVDELAEFERSQLETIVSTARSVRESLAAHAQEAETRISRLVQEELANLQAILQAPEKDLPEIAEQAAARFRNLSDTGKERIDKTEIANEESLSFKAREFEDKLEELVLKWKDEIYEKVSRHQEAFAAKTEKTVADLQQAAEKNLARLQERMTAGSGSVAGAIQASKQETGALVAQWRDEAAAMHESFSASLRGQRQDFEKVNTSKIDSAAKEAEAQIGGLARESREKMQASHKLMQSSLARLEQDLKRKLEASFSRFETAVSEAARRATGTTSSRQRTADELKEKLKNNLASQGEEVLRLVRKTASQVESEYVRASRRFDDRVEASRASAVDGLDKQVQALKLELDKINRTYQQELAELMTQADELEEAGKAAAVTIMAYRSAMLSLDGQ